MNIIVFHGGNYAVLSRKLGELRSQFNPDAVTQLSMKSLAFDQILLGLGTPSLFADKRLVIIEEADEKKIDISKFPNDEHVTVVLIFNKELGGSSSLLQNALKKSATIYALSLPQDKSVFQFLDFVGEKNGKALGAFEELYSQFGGQYLLTMLLYLFRRLIVPAKNQSYGAEKLERQRKNYSPDQISDCYFEILQTDFFIKSGKVEEKTALLLLIQKLII